MGNDSDLTIEKQGSENDIKIYITAHHKKNYGPLGRIKYYPEQRWALSKTYEHDNI